MRLLEREGEIALLVERLERVRRTGRGHMAFVAGEAGIGKTALVRAFSAAQPVPVVEGTCEVLFTPRPLGPFLDVAASLGGEFGALLETAPTPADVVRGLQRAIGRPHIIVLEDVHWADEATLDVLRLLTRRVRAMRALIVGTFRDDEVTPEHPLRRVLGETSGADCERIVVAPLSFDAVAELAEGRTLDARRLHEQTGGNPFYVTEVLAATAADRTPETVRDAVRARVGRLDAASLRLLEAIAVVPPRAELWLLETLAGEDFGRLEACLGTGIVRAEGGAVAFRHEIARATIEDDLRPDRRLALHRAVLAALAGQADPARLAHHAAAAQDRAAILEYAPAAAQRASALSAHREAAQQYDRVLAYAGGLVPAERVSLLERSAWSCYISGRVDDAIARTRDVIALHRRAGDRRSEASALVTLARSVWYRGQTRESLDLVRRAVALLEPLPPGPELARAYSALGLLGVLDYDIATATRWSERAVALAEQIGELETVAQSLGILGMAGLLAGDDEGATTAERGLELALVQGFEEIAARGRQNLWCIHIERREYAAARAHLDALEAYVEERDLDTIWLYAYSWKSRAELEQGRWDTAADIAHDVLGRPGLGPPTRLTPLIVLGLLRARRGDPDAWTPLDEALELAEGMQELQRLVPVAAARAEARWLQGEVARVADETDAVVERLRGRRVPWAVGPLMVWRHRAGLPTEAGGVVAPPFALELDGHASAAAGSWEALGCPYEAALARGGSGTEAGLRESLEALSALGATRAAAVVGRRLRERGVRAGTRGPRRQTRRNAAGLTARQLDVLALLAEGESNAGIATRLFLSERTVGHHVSAILRKLDARSRSQAVAAAHRLEILDRRPS